ncbi:hypothetical protein K440DRAFT_670297 [Wilcoxina mikolae CBS 423.85]|nr:hypothetical protein K440DRAFT_670297 [Wilcoxina mikolae CBS 423.85]
MNLKYLVLIPLLTVLGSGRKLAKIDDANHLASFLKVLENTPFYNQFESAYHDAAKSFFATQTILTGPARESLVNGANNYASLAGLREVLDAWTKVDTMAATTVQEGPIISATTTADASTFGSGITVTGGSGTATETAVETGPASTTVSTVSTFETHYSFPSAITSLSEPYSTDTVAPATTTNTRDIKGPGDLTAGGAIPAHGGVLFGIVAAVMAAVAF